MEEAVPRIIPATPPYPDDVEQQLASMMPPGTDPIGLFRTFVRNMPMATSMSRWGAYELSRKLSLSMRDREIIIDRTCARCHCEYEWGVHIAFFADRVGLTDEQVTSLTHGQPADTCWIDRRDQLLVETADALHDTATIDDRLGDELRRHYSDEQLLDIFMLAGWYHAISYAANGAQVELESGAPRFEDARSR
jgi:alkylhydroperoxidase family enzyme